MMKSLSSVLVRWVVWLLWVALPAHAVNYQLGERLPAGEQSRGYRTLGWNDLIPKDWNTQQDLQALNQASRLRDFDPRAMELLQRLKKSWDNAPVAHGLHQQAVQIAGFAIPLERKGDRILEFLLVPYFGACIHAPPPPANQTILVIPDKPVTGLRTLDAVQVSGIMEISRGDSGLGVFGYRLVKAISTPYLPATRTR